MLILLALQSNLAGSVLTNNGTLGAGITELKSDIAATIINSFREIREIQVPLILLNPIPMKVFKSCSEIAIRMHGSKKRSDVFFHAPRNAS